MSFFDTIGLNIHPNWNTTNWGSAPWMDRLMESGVLNTRGLLGHSKSVLDDMQLFFDAGGKHCATVSAGGINWTGTKANIDFIAHTAGLAQHISGIEGLNEFNHNPYTGWAADEIAFTKQTHDYVRSIPALANVPLVAPSVWKRQLTAYQALVGLAPYVDKGCIHYYSGAKRPTLTGGNTMAGALKDASIIAPGKPVYMTETGWMTGGNQPISQRAQAKYVLRNYCDAFGYGVEKVYTYELIDDQTNLFGICDANANPKLAFTALKNFVALVNDTADGQSSLAFTLSSVPSLKHLTLPNRDGSTTLILWLDVDSYVKGDDVETSHDVTLTLASSARIDVYQPTFNASMVKTGSASTMTFPVGDHVTVVRVR